MRVRKDMQDSENLIKFGTKACPKCKAPHEKNGGCNHMTCGHCRTDWCWICNSDITGGIYEHYSGILQGCSGMQFTDMRYFVCAFNQLMINYLLLITYFLIFPSNSFHFARAADGTFTLCNRFCGSCGRLTFLTTFQFLRYLLIIIDVIILLSVLCGSLFLALGLFSPGFVIYLLGRAIIKLVHFCTSNSPRHFCLDNFIEVYFTCSAYFSIFLFTGIFWIVSVIVILAPLFIYLFGMLVANTWFDGQYEWRDFDEIFKATIFHVPIFIYETIAPDTS